MARVRLHANALCPRPKKCPLPFADWMTSVLQATGGASAGKSDGPARASVKLPASSGSARLATGATGSTEWNCARPYWPIPKISEPACCKGTGNVIEFHHYDWYDVVRRGRLMGSQEMLSS